MTSAARPQGYAAAIGYNLACIAVLVLLAAVGAGYGLDRLSRFGQPALPHLGDGNRLTQTIAGTELSIPASWFRFNDQLREGFTSQIDLRVMLRSGHQAVATPIDITLLPPSQARTSASLLDAVYLHQFGEDTLSGVAGLVGKPMTSGSYAGESVWYDAISPNPFVAKCARAIADRPEQCVRTVYLPSGIAAVYTFDASVLPSWRQFDSDMQQWLAVIGAWP